MRTVGAHRLLRKISVGLNYPNDLIPFLDKLDNLTYTSENRKVLIFLFADDIVTLSEARQALIINSDPT